VSARTRARSLDALDAAVLLYYTFTSGFAVILPPYLRDLGVSGEASIGAIVSATFMTSLALRLAVGVLGERLGYAAVLRAGSLCAAAACALYLAGDVTLLVAGRVLHGLSLAAFPAMSLALAALEGPRAMAVRSLMVGIGNVLGPVASTAAYGAGGGPAAAAATLAMSAATVPLVWRARPALPRINGEQALEPRVVVLTALLTLFVAVHAAVYTFTPLRVKQLGLPVAYWGVFTAVAAATSLPFRALARQEELARPALASLATAIAAAGLFLATRAGDALSFALAGAVYGAGQGLVIVMYQVLALAGVRSAGVASAVYTMGWDAGFIAGPLMAGVLVGALGYDSLSLVPALLAANVIALLCRRPAAPRESFNRRRIA
jgi:MFS family permease